MMSMNFSNIAILKMRTTGVLLVKLEKVKIWNYCKLLIQLKEAYYKYPGQFEASDLLEVLFKIKGKVWIKELINFFESTYKMEKK